MKTCLFSCTWESLLTLASIWLNLWNLLLTEFCDAWDNLDESYARVLLAFLTLMFKLKFLILRTLFFLLFYHLQKENKKNKLEDLFFYSWVLSSSKVTCFTWYVSNIQNYACSYLERKEAVVFKDVLWLMWLWI